MPLDVGGNILNSSVSRLLNNNSYYTTNLVYLWDAGIAASYPGSGSSWTEWVSGTYNGTLENGAYYSSAGGGSIAFDGADDRVTFSTFSLSNVPWSCSMWIKFSSANQMGLFSHYSGGPVYNVFGVNSGKLQYVYYNNAGWNYSPLSNTAINNNTWKYVTFSTGANSTSTFTFYVNGIADGTFTPVSNGIGSGNMGVFGSYWGFNYFAGNIAHCSVHNSQLTQAQILQNFNSTRVRFGA
jgi:hypothetical protein